MRRTRTRTRRRSLAGCVALLIAAGCGGGGDTAPSPPRPAIDAAVAERLAAASEAIAASLDAGDLCGAAGLADDLDDAIEAAIAGGQVPPAFQDDLRAKATELVNAVNCPEPEPRPAPTQTAEPQEVEDADDEKRGPKKKDREKNDADEPVTTVELPPTETTETEDE